MVKIQNLSNSTSTVINGLRPLQGTSVKGWYATVAQEMLLRGPVDGTVGAIRNERITIRFMVSTRRSDAQELSTALDMIAGVHFVDWVNVKD